MSKLNPVAQKWVDALRSGKYQQGQSWLKSDGRFCCLGVLCDLALADGVQGQWKDRGNYSSFADLREERTGRLPRSVMKWAKLTSAEGFYKDGDLVLQNDQGKSFAEIADIIEQHADELFEPESA